MSVLTNTDNSKLEITFNTTAVKLVCDDLFYPQLIIGNHVSSYFLMTRNQYSTVGSSTVPLVLTPGIENTKVNKYIVTSTIGGAPTFAVATSSEATEFRTSMTLMPIVGLTCFKAGVRVYQFYQVVKKAEVTSITATDDVSATTVPTVKALTYASPTYTLDIFDAGTKFEVGDAIKVVVFTADAWNPLSNYSTDIYRFVPNAE